MGKKYATLYAQMFDVLHADDKFIATSPYEYDAVIDRAITALKETCSANNLYFMHKYTGVILTRITERGLWRKLAESVLSTLVCSRAGGETIDEAIDAPIQEDTVIPALRRLFEATDMYIGDTPVTIEVHADTGHVLELDLSDLRRMLE